MSVVAGFLGAGKTTWLRHQLAQGVFQDASVVVNEAARQPIDDALLTRAKQVSVISGGCACCERKADLIAELRQLCAHAPPPRDGEIQRIVLECSGLADPRPIVEAVRSDPDLSQRLEVGEVISIVGAEGALDLLRREPLARRQLREADCIILSKLEDASEAALKPLLATLQTLAPRAAVFGANRGVEAALPQADDATPEDLPPLADDDDPPMAATQIELGPIGWPVFAVWLSALLHARGRDILRVKGVVRAATGRLLIQAAQGDPAPAEILPEPPRESDGTLVLIGRGLDREALQRSLEGFAKRAEARE